MAKIKTRDAAKSGVKAVGKVASAGERMKRAYVRGKAHAQSGTGENSPGEYAADQMTQGMEGIAHGGIVQVRRQGKNGLQSTSKRISKGGDLLGSSSPPKARDNSAGHTESRISGVGGKEPPSGQAPLPTERARQLGRKRAIGRLHSRHFPERPPHTIKTVDQAHRDIKTIDRRNRTVAGFTEKTLKSAQHTATTVMATEQPARAMERSARAITKSAKVTAQGANTAAKATVSTVKAILTAGKALVSALIAGGWATVLILILVCLIGLVVASPFGVFFSGEDSGSGPTMQMAVREINEDFQARIDTIKASTSYDAVEISGSRAAWKEVLAIYAVKTSTDPANAQEVATMDNSKKALLKSVFWEMTTVSSRTETESSTDTELRDDGSGDMVEVEVTTTYTTLYISIHSITADEMATQLHFTPAQLSQLAELLAEENNGLWNAVLYGIRERDCDIVSVALSQLGNVGGDPYWSWYGFPSHVNWCACFVSWCANECGYIDTGVFPKFASCSDGVAWFQGQGLWRDNSYTPEPGDLIFFDWDDEEEGQDGTSDHVGIVERMEGNTVYTVEGNSGNCCRQRYYPMGDHEILGYGAFPH